MGPLAALHRAGRLAGRLDSRWRPTVTWRCVTGDAQLAVLLHRLERYCPGEGHAETARNLIEEVARMQLYLCGLGGLGLDSAGLLANGSNPASGGVPGSFPVWGGYVRLGLPNWAAKFYLDALLLELYGVDEMSSPTPSRPPQAPPRRSAMARSISDSIATAGEGYV